MAYVEFSSVAARRAAERLTPREKHTLLQVPLFGYQTYSGLVRWSNADGEDVSAVVNVLLRRGLLARCPGPWHCVDITEPGRVLRVGGRA